MVFGTHLAAVVTAPLTVTNTTLFKAMVRLSHPALAAGSPRLLNLHSARLLTLLSAGGPGVHALTPQCCLCGWWEHESTGTHALRLTCCSMAGSEL